MKRLLSQPPVSAPADQVAAVLPHVRSIEDFVSRAVVSESLAQAIAAPHLAGPLALRQLALEVSAQLRPRLERASEVYERQMSQDTLLKTGARLLDEALGGGVATGEVTELMGPPLAGKSQLAMAMCAQQLASTSSRVLFVDTCCGFRAERVYQMMGTIAHKMTREQRKERLSQLLVRRATSLLALLEVVDQLSSELAAGGGGGMRLFIIDSVYSALIGDHTNISCSATGAQVARLQQSLRRLASYYRLAVVLINSAIPVSSSRDAVLLGSSQAPLPQQVVGCHQQFWRAALGQQWLHTADVRIALRPDPDASPELFPIPHLLSIIKCSLSERNIATADDCISLTITSRGMQSQQLPGSREALRSIRYSENLSEKCWSGITMR